MSDIYQITIYKQIIDPEKVAAYAALAGPAITAGGGTFVARGEPVATKEQGEVTRTVIIKWPDLETAYAAFASPGYVEALNKLDGGAIRDIRYVPAC